MSFQLVNPKTAYSFVSKLLHWSMAFLVMLMFFAFLGFQQADTELKTMEMLVGHSSIGFIILILLCVRLYNTFVKRAAKPNHEIAPWQKRLSNFSHKLLYFLLILVPTTGLLTAMNHKLPVMLFGNFNLSAGLSTYSSTQFQILKSIHVFAIYTLLLVLTIHIAAALYHKFILKDDVFDSMWRKK